MPEVPSRSPTTGAPVAPYFLHTTEGQFVDNAGRTVILRGVNLSGADKAPVDRPSYAQDDFFDAGERGDESFVGRPLNLDDGSADVHLARLRGWGFNLLRYVVTWEALEHAGPGKFDYDFMDYTVRVIRKCKEHGFRVLMDPHQDTWSRYAGGSGAPYWTIPACGLDPRRFTPTQSAIIHCEYPNAAEANPANLPAMIWSTNYGRLASQTLFTLFFAGRDFAPKCIIDGMNIQDYLQSHFITAMGHLADRIREASDLLDVCVLGWDSMNEPYEGLCGYPDLNKTPTQQTSTLKKGSYPTPAQSFRLGMGRAQTVESWSFGQFGPKREGSVTVDPKGVRVWSDPSTEPGGVHPRWGWKRDPDWELGTCLWAQHGVWDVESGEVLVPNYFNTASSDPSHQTVFILDYWKAHWRAFATRIRQSHPEAILFVAPPVFAQPPPIDPTDLQGRCCYSTHYYDGLTLVSRHWSWFNADALGLLRGKYSSTLPAVKIGERAIRKSLQEQLGMLKEDAPILGPFPTIIGEIGIPYDMDSKKSYGWTDNGKYKGDYTNQQKALDASLNAADGPNALNYTIWNYCPDNCHAWGDNWDMEDLSIWSPDDLRPREGYSMGSRSSSSAKLTKDAAIVMTTSAAASSVSLNSVRGGSGAMIEDVSKGNLAFFSRWENAYDFLTDGARAVKAFCRPYPTTIIGIPKDIQFDISRAEFKLTVRVRPEDAPKAVRLKGYPADGEPEEALATEIYVPLVHYAGETLAQMFSDQGSEPLAGKSSSYTTGSSSHTAASLFAPDATPLSLSVRVSDGRWAVEGQTLKWWYGVPPPGASEREYTITITRAGGPIKTAEEAEFATTELAEELLSCIGDVCSLM